MGIDLIKIMVEKSFGEIKSIPVFLIACAIFSMELYKNLENRIVFIFGVFLFVFYTIVVFKYNSLSKASKNKNTILIRIEAKNKEEYEDIKYKFGTEFEKFITTSNSNFDVLYIKYHLFNKYKSKVKEDIINLLEKTNCFFLIDLKNKSEELNDNAIYITELNLGILHPKYKKLVTEKFQKEFTILGAPTSKLKYSKEEKIEKLESAAQQVSLVCEYIVGRAYYLNEENQNAQSISKNLKNKLNINSDKNLIKMVNNLGYESSIQLAINEYAKNFIDYKFIDQQLVEANRYKKNTYTYYEFKAICAFQNGRNIKDVQIYLGACKKIMSRGSWQYSDAFISAYIEKSEGTVLNKYKQALENNNYSDHMQLISFIEDILEKENKNMLKFALVILYSEINQYAVANKILIEYLKNKQSGSLDENTEKTFRKKYNTDLFLNIKKQVN